MVTMDMRAARPESAGARNTVRRRLAVAAAALAVVTLAVSLGAWQLRRADEKRALQAQADEAARAEPVRVPGERIAPAGLDGRRVAVRGRMVGERTVFIDNRTRKGVAGFHVVTPVRIEGSSLHVLVLRGWVARDPRDRARLPEPPAPEGVVEIEGLAQAVIPKALELGSAPAPGPGERLWQNLDFDAFEAWSGLALQRILVRQLGEPGFADGLARDWTEAGGDVGKHLGYAFQWFTMAAATAALWVYFSFFRRRDDNRDAD